MFTVFNFNKILNLQLIYYNKKHYSVAQINFIKVVNSTFIKEKDDRTTIGCFEIIQRCLQQNRRNYVVAKNKMAQSQALKLYTYSYYTNRGHKPFFH